MRRWTTQLAAQCAGTLGLLVGLGAATACGDAMDLEIDPTEEVTAAILESNGLPSNGLPSNGLSANGLPSNGLPSNGLPSNGLSANGMTSGALPSSGAALGTFNNWFHWFQGCQAADGCNTSNPSAGSTGKGTATSRAQAATIMKYIVQCACASGTTKTYTDRAGTKWSWPGKLGLAPTWCPASGGAAPPVAEQEWVSACLMATVNRFGGSQGSLVIRIVKNGTNNNADIEQQIFGQSQGAVYGNMFGSLTSGAKGRFTAPASPTAASNAHGTRNGRDCGSANGCGVMTVPGYGHIPANSPNYFPAPGGDSFPALNDSGHVIPWTTVCSGDASVEYKSCVGGGFTWTRVMEVAVPRIQTPLAGTYAHNSVTPSSSMVNCTRAADESAPFCSGNDPTLMVKLQDSTARWTVGQYVQIRYATTVKVRLRYKSSLAASVRFRTGVGTYSTRPSTWGAWKTASLPATGNRWRFSDGVSFSTPQLSSGEAIYYQLGGVDSTSKNADIDELFDSL